MKKMAFIAIPIVAVLIAVAIIVFPANTTEINTDNGEKQKLSLYESIELLNRLQDHFHDGRKVRRYPDYEIEYPEWYAGVYLDDSQQAVVMVTDASPKIIELIYSITRNETIAILKAEHSFNQMLDAIKTLYAFEKYPFSYITSLDEKANAVVVTIDAALNDTERTEAVAMITSNVVCPDVLIFGFGNVEIMPS